MLYSDLNNYKEGVKRWIVPGLFVFLLIFIVISLVIIQHQSKAIDTRNEKIAALEDDVSDLKRELALQSKLTDAYKKAADDQLALFKQNQEHFKTVKSELNSSLEKHKEYESQELPLDIRNIANGIRQGINPIPLKPKE